LLTKDELGAGGPGAAVDSDGDGKKDYLDADDDNDGIPTAKEVVDSKLPGVGSDDLDSDGKKNWLDTDSDADESPDTLEPADNNKNGIPDYLEVGFTPVPKNLVIDGTLEGGGLRCTTSAGSTAPSGAIFMGLGLAVAALVSRRCRATRK
jgi:hypothetical protein